MARSIVSVRIDYMHRLPDGNGSDTCTHTITNFEYKMQMNELVQNGIGGGRGTAVSDKYALMKLLLPFAQLTWKIAVNKKPSETETKNISVKCSLQRRRLPSAAKMHRRWIKTGYLFYYACNELLHVHAGVLWFFAQCSQQFTRSVSAAHTHTH